MVTILAFLVAIAILVVIHEYGHYWVARRCGVKVLRFSVGFGKVIYSKRFSGGDTEWVISAIPLGGYVKMLDEREGEVEEKDLPYAFNRKSVGQRMAIVAAGPIANFLLAIVLYWVLFAGGVMGLKPVVGEVPAGTPAAAAGMQADETVVKVEDVDIPSWQDLGWTVLDLSLKQDEITLQTVDKGGYSSFYTLDVSGLVASELEGEFLSKLGLYVKRPLLEPILGRVLPEGAAAAAGLQSNDRVVSVNQQTLTWWQDFVEVVRASPEQPLQLTFERDGVLQSVVLTPAVEMEGEQRIGKVGAGPFVDPELIKDSYVEISYGPLGSLSVAVQKSWEISIVTLKMLGKMVMGEVSVKNLSGPITIADYAGSAAQSGWVPYLSLLALISISIGIFNLLPIPLLDGGHLLYYCVEIIKGGPVSEQAWITGQKIGIALLGTVMIFAIYNDISRLVSG